MITPIIPKISIRFLLYKMGAAKRKSAMFGKIIIPQESRKSDYFFRFTFTLFRYFVSPARIRHSVENASSNSRSLALPGCGMETIFPVQEER